MPRKAGVFGRSRGTSPDAQRRQGYLREDYGSASVDKQKKKDRIYALKKLLRDKVITVWTCKPCALSGVYDAVTQGPVYCVRCGGRYLETMMPVHFNCQVTDCPRNCKSFSNVNATTQFIEWTKLLNEHEQTVQMALLDLGTLTTRAEQLRAQQTSWMNEAMRKSLEEEAAKQKIRTAELNRVVKETAASTKRRKHKSHGTDIAAKVPRRKSKLLKDGYHFGKHGAIVKDR